MELNSKAAWLFFPAMVLPLVEGCGADVSGCGTGSPARAGQKQESTAGGKAPEEPAPKPVVVPSAKAPVRPSCDARYRALLSPLDITQACRTRTGPPVEFADPSGCLFRYQGKGTLLLMESLSYWELRRQFGTVSFISLPTGPGFWRFSRDRRASTVVMRISGGSQGRALYLQAPVALCSPDDLRKLAGVVSLRMSRLIRRGKGRIPRKSK